jgi:hypothetical protein
VRTLLAAALLVTVLPGLSEAQARRFPPDSLVNTKVIPHNTPVRDVVNTMRGFTGDLGVRCQFCHVGQEGQSLDQFDFTKDDKETKQIARQMMRMVAEINRRLDTLPGRAPGDPVVTCRTCHRGTQEPVPLPAIIATADSEAGIDSAMKAYRNLRDQYYGRDSYDFGESSLVQTAFRLARGGKVDDALALLTLNETYYPTSSMSAANRGNLQLMKGDTNAAVTAYRQAIQRDSTNREARRALQQIGRTP